MRDGLSICQGFMLSAWIGLAGLAWTPAAGAAVLYMENFADVSEWAVSLDSGGGSTITSDGSLGLFYVNAANSFSVFIPVPSASTLSAYDPAHAFSYRLSLDVDSVTYSTSYMIAMDLFGASSNYLSTTFDIIPQTAQTGEVVIGLGSFAFDPATRYIAPKVYVFTGDGSQTVRFDSLEIGVAPEPGTVVLILSGCLLLRSIRKRTSPQFRAACAVHPRAEDA